MHLLTQVVSDSKVNPSSEGVCIIPGRHTAVSSAVQLWESKVMQSKAMEGLRKNTNPSNFVLQLPASYTQTDQELTGKLKLLTNKRSTFTLLVINTAASFAP